MLGVTFAVSMFNALALISTANVIFVTTGKDTLTFFLLYDDKWHFAPVLIGWMLLHYALMETTGLKREALSRYSDQKYSRKGGGCVLLAIGANVVVVILSSVLYIAAKF